MGMIYIIYGPPWYVSYELVRTTWQYGYGYSSFSPVFVFNRTRRGSSRFPFDNWILRRSSNLHQDHYNRVQEWLSGYVLDSSYPYWTNPGLEKDHADSDASFQLSVFLSSDKYHI